MLMCVDFFQSLIVESNLICITLEDICVLGQVVIVIYKLWLPAASFNIVMS